MKQKEFKVKVVGDLEISQLDKNFYSTLFEYLFELHSEQKVTIAK